jgi:hypothetical protein
VVGGGRTHGANLESVVLTEMFCLVLSGCADEE